MDGEELLWELAGLEAEMAGGGAAGAGRELPETALQGYRSGRMTAAESDRVEAALIASRDERRRLEALAGVRILAPASVRRRLFGDAGGSVERRPRAGWRAAPWRVLAAASVALLALLCLWQAGQRGLLPGINRGAAVRPLPEYRVQLTGAASFRSITGESGVSAGGSGTGAVGGDSGPRGTGGQARGPETLPETVVEISVLPETAPSTPVEFGLYRRVEGGLRRVPQQEILALETNRGAASLRLKAGSLVGETAGTRSFFIVVTEPGDLRDELSVTGASSAAEALQVACGGRVYERTITIVGRESGAGKP